MSYPLLTRCPICAGELIATRLDCVNCHGSIEGQFDLGLLKRLTPEQIQLIALLVKNRGNMNRVASELGVHYNTVRNRMDELAAAMGYGEAPPPPRSERLDVLERLGRGELTPEEALAQLKAASGNQPQAQP
ncbi:DUF2089 domain-containing protein [Kallotenue papyrolyticum]|uniref:DUF2089 domain-containing protein n=1 Tax=Kallotenue papyrolyticum TaxID=1325125 RepID=UPI0004786557|nr:DUF2089 domain-containing protein [Kallotenue papyrolyticum]